MDKKVKFNWPIIYKTLFKHVSLLHRLYYRRITVVGYEKIPSNTPVIFAPNHQNALMDALALNFTAKKPIVFLGRADIFKKPFIAKTLNMLRILPIYRIRDGYESLGNNQEVFDKAVEVLKSNIPLCILPEGNHEGKKRLRSLKKGIFRIAFQAEESASFNLNLHIVPVGLDYSDYFNAGSDLMVVFGTPIKVSDYAVQYKENEQKTVNKLREILAEGMQNVMIHIPSKDYEVTHQLSEMFEPNVWNTCNVKRHPYNRLTIKQYIIQKSTEAFTANPDKAIELGSLFQHYNARIEALSIKDCMFQQKPPRLLLTLSEITITLLLSPLFIYGIVANLIPFLLTIQIASKTKDPHFKSSIQFGIGMVLFPLYYLLVITAFCILSDEILVKIIFGLTLPVSGVFAFYLYRYMKKLWVKIRLLNLKLSDNETYKSILNERNAIINFIKATLNN